MKKIVFFHSKDELLWHRGKPLEDIVSSSESYVYNHIELLRQLRTERGWEVVLCRMDEVYDEGGYRAAERLMLAHCRDADYAFLLVSASPHFLHTSTLRALKAARPETQIVLYSHDEMKHQATMTRAIARGADAILVVDHPRGAEALRRELGNVAFFHGNSRRSFARRDVGSPRYDVSFIGSDKGKRAHYCDLVSRERPRLRCRFVVPRRPYFEQPEKLDLEGICEITSQSRINLSCNEKYPGRLHLSTRIWQIMLGEALTLAEYTPDLEYLFDIEKDLFVFRDEDELLAQIDFILDPANRDEVERRRRIGSERANRVALENLTDWLDEGLDGRAIIEACQHPASLRDADLPYPRPTYGRYREMRVDYMRSFLRRGELGKVLPELHALLPGLGLR